MGFEITIKGIVQGVGFRPFIFRIAEKFHVVGTIRNHGNLGVKIKGKFKPKPNSSAVLDEDSGISQLIQSIIDNKPQISYIESISNIKIPDDEITHDSLEIQPSIISSDLVQSLVLPPDVGICNDCLSDFYNRDNPRYYHYPFIACAECGPRYSTVIQLPYDRERTTMDEFPLCGDPKHLEPHTCLSEYSDVNNRRFHAQTFSCSNCGPKYLDSVSKAIDIIKNGKIIAVKGIGGTHLVCSALNREAIETLRQRKGGRKYKPFALMYPSLECLQRSGQFNISDVETRLLTSFRRPIILLDKSDGYSLPDNIAPRLPNVGIMLPYAGIHYLLFEGVGDIPLIYTSGNPSNIPMAIENAEIRDSLESLVDGFLLHNRVIHQRVDDSVIRVVGGKSQFIRRSRGYVPEYIPLPFETDEILLACGGEENSTGAILCNSRIFPTQHIGTVNTEETLDFLNKSIEHLSSLLGIKPAQFTGTVHDLHPQFLSNGIAKDFSEKFRIRNIEAQHHHAHHASLMLDSGCKLSEEIISISVDGIGYGPDGSIWGGEILHGGYESVRRVGSISAVPMIGGDRSTIFPARMLSSFLLFNHPKSEALNLLSKLNIESKLEYKATELSQLVNQFDDNGNLKSNQQMTSSTGRFLDAVSYLIGTCNYRSYRGEPAMTLEGTAYGGKIIEEFSVESYIENNKLNTHKILWDLSNEYVNKKSSQDIAYTVLHELGRGLGIIGLNLCRQFDVKKIGCTGGVAINKIFIQGFLNAVNNAKDSHVIALQHQNVAPGDAGISVGQLGIASAILKQQKK